jgi:hypothetical protein
VVAVALTVMITAVAFGIRLGARSGPPAGCVARAGAGEVDLDVTQARNAVLIATIALDRGLPHRAVEIAIATALQESKLRNLHYGDADSLGLFQQRPSQGWGTPAQILDPTHATDAFYDALVAISGWQQLPVTVAAQRVQRSAYPDAYAAHEADAAVIAAAATGTTAAGLACTRLTGTPGSALGAAAVPAALTAAFTGSGPRLSATATGPLTLAVTVRAGSTGNTTSAVWAVAGWLIAHADDDQLTTVEVGRRRWTSRTGSAPWVVSTDAPDPTGVTVVVEPVG